MSVNTGNVSIVLNEPHYPENIGSAARVTKNMGLGPLIVVRPMNCDLTRILTLATHAAEDVVANMEVYDDLRDALAPFGYVAGTTARKGSHRAVMTPRTFAAELAPVTMGNRVAVLFGTESSGLSNEALKYCDALVMIPTADFSSLNLAQAVMVLAYEIFSANIDQSRPFTPKLAQRFELENMYDHLRDVLVRINFINPENPEYWMMSIRRFFSRIGLRAREVKLIRGICRQIDWYCSRYDEKGEGPPAS